MKMQIERSVGFDEFKSIVKRYDLILHYNIFDKEIPVTHFGGSDEFKSVMYFPTLRVTAIMQTEPTPYILIFEFWDKSMSHVGGVDKRKVEYWEKLTAWREEKFPDATPGEWSIK
jgi:hypothetical protein